MALKVIKGQGTIAWGTSGIIGGNSIPSGSIAPSIKLTPKNGKPIEIEDNDGVAAIEVLLRDGFDAKAQVMYDATKNYPIEGANCTLAIPWGGVSANSPIPFGEPGTNGGSATAANGIVTFTCLVVAMSPAYEKKKEAYIDFDVTYRPNVAV